MIFKHIVIFLLWANLSNGANILAFMGSDVRSHLIAVSAFLEHLAPYHNITFFKASTLQYSHPKITAVDVATYSASHIPEMQSLLQKPCNINYFNIFYKHILHENLTHYEHVYNDKNIKKLLKQRGHYDLVIINGYGSDHYFALAHALEVPVIQITPSLLFHWNNEASGNPMNWDSDVNFLVSENTDTFYGRIVQYFKNVLIYQRFYSVTFKAMNKIIPKYIPSTPPIEEIMKTTSLVFSNTHSAMGFPQPGVPTLISVGGMHIKPPKMLKPVLEEFLSHKDGFVYFSLGTTVREDTLNQDILGSIVKTLGKIKKRVLWKWTGNLNFTLPQNVVVSRWFSQQDILRHRNIKLFITQGGMLSMVEASSFGVPVLVMPVLFDQYTNAKMAYKMGYGLYLDFCEFTEKLFFEKINSLISDSRFRQKAKQISEIMQFDISTMNEKINFWVDFVIKNKKNMVLKETKKTQKWTQMMAVDTFIFIFTIILLFIAILSYISYHFLSYLRSVMPVFKIKLQ